ncbi:MAG: hypothetical protein WCR78_04680 [Arcobacteraceae bacterium]
MQSNKQSNLPFYQNNTNIQNNLESVINTQTLSIEDLLNHSSSFDDMYSYLNKFFTKEQLIKFDNEMNINLLDVCFTKKHCILILCKKYGFEPTKYFVWNDYEVFDTTENIKVTPQIENEIQILDNQIQVTQTQINRINKLNSFATFLQKKSNKKSFYKYRQILLSIRNKIDLKQRVLNLLVWEKERLIKFA